MDTDMDKNNAKDKDKVKDKDRGRDKVYGLGREKFSFKQKR